MGSTALDAFDVVYQKSNEGGVVLCLGLALPAGSTLRGPCTSVITLIIAICLSGFETLPKVECPNHKAMLQYLSSN